MPKLIFNPVSGKFDYIATKSDLDLTGTNSGDVTVTDSSTIDFTLTGQSLTGSVIQGGITHNNLASLQGGIAGEYNHLTNAQVTALHAAVTVTDTASVDLTLAGQALSATVLPAGVDHGGLGGLLDDDHTQYLLKSTYDANTIIKADTDNTPIALTVGASTIVGRASTGNIAALTASQVATIVQGSVDHGSITGLADDDHTQYALLAGRSGGQSLSGGTAANDDLTLQGTTDATRTTSYVLLQPTAGNVGIGTTSPATALAVTFTNSTAPTSGTTPSGISVSYGAADGNNGGIWFSPVMGGSQGISGIASTRTSGFSVDLRFYTNNTASNQAFSERMRIDASGNVGIGTTSPTAGFKLDVNGSIYASSDIRAQGIFRDYQGEALLQTTTSAVTQIGTTGAGTSRQLTFLAGNAEQMRILTNGNVGINDTAPSAQLHVDQTSTTAAKPTLRLQQADLSEEFIRFDTTVGTGNPTNTSALGTYYGRVRVHVQGVGEKWLALYNT